MCLIILTNNFHKNYNLILAANRDEFYNRATVAAKFWDNYPELLAGKDLEAGGTWLGITKSGRYSAITNFREPQSLKKNMPSRGVLPVNFLTGGKSSYEYITTLMKDSKKFNGFNLLAGDLSELYFFSNKIDHPQKLEPGVYGLSNHLLDTPWSKVVRSKEVFRKIIEDDEPSVEKLFELLSDKTLPPDDELPDTGMGIAIERIAAPVFIESASYGTRSSTVILIDKNNNVRFIEKSLQINSGKRNWTTAKFEFNLVNN